MMDGLRAGLMWPGTEAMLSLFVVRRGPADLELTVDAAPAPRPDTVRQYEMMPGDSGSTIGEVREYDLRFNELPPDLTGLVSAWLESAIGGGAEVAWFGFEGSFSYEDLLSDDIASSIFAVASRSGIYLALDDDFRSSSEWVERLGEIRRELHWQ
ncbi:hypothetical protein [Microbacterium sulfonylureivorans]|uniref:hypothetical protein n=1 Tax=Microbacterium sulfonylureivorans TaxID=2486854 RepID=UPI000FD8BEBE|nr:hypothetical protein [Microbacterium sulfonylureivorans]